MRTYASVLLRIPLVAVCCFATFKSVQHARAELASASGTPEGLARAIQIEPDDYSLLARAALLRGENGDDSPAAGQALLEAARLNPLDAEILMNLGLKEELQGNLAEAEKHLVRATELNRSFKPAWALASFCYRTHQPDRFWPMAKHCLSLEPLLYDPSPVFDLSWKMSEDSRKIAAILPREGPVRLQYLSYLIGTARIEAAAEFWPDALNSLRGATPAEIETAIGYSNFLARHQRTQEAVRPWNQLIDRGFVHSGRLDPAAGISISDPDFNFATTGSVFDWQLATADGLFVASSQAGKSGITLEFDGNEPQTIQLMSTLAPVMAGKSYRLKWKGDSSGLERRDDAGFVFRITQQPGGPAIECPLLAPENGKPCQFTGAPDLQQARIDLLYTRALGTTRARGALQISTVRLEFAS